MLDSSGNTGLSAAKEINMTTAETLEKKAHVLKAIAEGCAIMASSTASDEIKKAFEKGALSLLGDVK